MGGGRAGASINQGHEPVTMKSERAAEDFVGGKNCQNIFTASQTSDDVARAPRRANSTDAVFTLSDIWGR